MHWLLFDTSSSHFYSKTSLHLCTKQTLNLSTSVYWFFQIVKKPVLSKVDFTVSTLLKWKVSCFSVCNLNVSLHRIDDIFPGFPNFRFSHKFIILVLIFVDMLKGPVSPYSMQFGVNLNVFSKFRRKFRWKISISLRFSQTHISAAYSKTFIMSVGRRKIFAFSMRANIAFMPWEICLPIVFLNEPL